MAEPGAGAPQQAGGAVKCSLPASWVRLQAHAAGMETQAASQVAVRGGILPGAQAVPVTGARNIAEAMSYGDGHPPTHTQYAWQKVNCALFPFGSICRLHSDQRHCKL